MRYMDLVSSKCIVRAHIRPTDNDSCHARLLLLGVNCVIDPMLMALTVWLAFLSIKISS